MKKSHVLILVIVLILLVATIFTLIYKNRSKINSPVSHCVHHEAMGDFPAEDLCTTN